jgi:exopolysaccharide biosynthesis polyprenyl glycosylphosphotransferase
VVGLTRPLRAVVVGSPSTARLLLREPLAPGAPAFELAGLVVDGGSAGAGDGLPVLGEVDDLEAILGDTPCDLVVIGSRTGRPAIFARLLAVSHLRLHIVELPEFFEREFGRVPVEEITSVWFLQALNRTRGGPAAAVKRVLDVLVALGVGLLAAPLAIGAAIAVRLTSPGPILYRQLRVGEHGRPYWVMKFRSMRVDAEADGAAVWASTDDPRTTSVGKHLRRFRIDELPQLLNVLRGDMTMVGPRPERPEFVEDLVEAVPFYEPRHMTKPGLTGWAQVTAGYAATLDDSRLKLSYDLYYLKHRSLALDLTILLRTVGVVLKGTGAR